MHQTMMMNDDDLTDLLKEYSKVESKEKHNRQAEKIKGMYPNSGAFARELYVKHMEFFRARTKERLFIAGNRCVSPLTLLETPEHGMVSAYDFFLHPSLSCLKSWDGETERTGQVRDVFLSGFAPMFRLVMDNGQFCDIPADHRLLTQDSSFVAVRDIIQGEAGLLFQKASGYQWNCDNDSDPDGVRLPLCTEGERGKPHTEGDAHPHSHLSEREDGGVRRYARSTKPDSDHGRPSSSYDLQAIRAWLFYAEDLLHRCDRLLQKALHQIFSQDLRDDNPLPLGLEDGLCQFLASSQDRLADISTEPLKGEAEEFLTLALGSCPYFAVEQHDEPSSLVAWEKAASSSLFVPFKHVSLMGGRKIVAILPLGIAPMIDFSVQDYNNYKAGGVFNHNCGKTISGAYEMALHLTGLYPDWWEGRRFPDAITAWAAGKTNESTRDIVQQELLGNVGGEKIGGSKNVTGTGMIPKERIGHITWKSGIPNLVDTVLVKHVSGGWSKLGMKTYAQGRDVFEGTAQHAIWFDEEPPLSVYTEALMRTMTTDGIIYTTFTPLQGLSDTVMRFLPDGQMIEGSDLENDRTVVTMTWDDAPHLSAETRKKMFSALPPNERDARSKGMPSLGAGAIYPVPESEIVVAPFEIPPFWSQGFAMDVGWNKTAVLWGALDQENDILYIYSEHYQGDSQPILHAEAIKARGTWMSGVIDPAARGRSQVSGEQLYQIYLDHGLNLIPANNSVESGIYKVWERLTTGRLKIFSTALNFWKEYRVYRRDEKGHIFKKDDHCFQGDTRIITDKGLVKIKDMVGTEGNILSLNGAWMPYHNVRLTKEQADLIEVTFDDGYSVKCTPDHLFLTSEGWVKAFDLQGKDCCHNAHAEDYALRKCVKIAECESDDVYCMSVPLTHAFSLENGAIVHNCMDALRYLVVSGIDVFSVNYTKAEDSVFGHLRNRHRRKMDEANDYDPE